MENEYFLIWITWLVGYVNKWLRTGGNGTNFGSGGFLLRDGEG